MHKALRRTFLALLLMTISIHSSAVPADQLAATRAQPQQAPTGDSVPAPAPPLPTGIATEELYGTAIRTSKWKRSPIEVCWLAMPAAEAKARELVQRAVAETWEKHSKARFSGWGQCTASPKGIRIRVADEAVAPHVKYIGRYSDGRDPGMVLNFTFAQWRKQCQQTRDFCIYAIAAHEFGHALGFTHEQNRADAPDTCRELKEGASGDYKVTHYDPASIMNYCNEHWNGDGRLSALDIAAVQAFYGAA